MSQFPVIGSVTVQSYPISLSSCPPPPPPLTDRIVLYLENLLASLVGREDFDYLSLVLEDIIIVADGVS